MKNNIVIKHLNLPDFLKLKNLLKSLLRDFNEHEPYAFTLTIGNKHVIVMYDDPDLTENEHKIILWHETAHARGIEDEEEADKYAFLHLNKEQKNLLIKNWEGRHGHPYKQ